MSRLSKHDPCKNTFPLPNEIFLLGLCPGELAVYAYLLRCENRKTHQCWPSYKTIGKAVNLSENTVRKHVCSLVDRGLIQTENTTVMTKAGLKRNGNLLYTLPPFQLILDDHYRQQFEKAKSDAARTRWEANDKSHERPCVAL